MVASGIVNMVTRQLRKRFPPHNREVTIIFLCSALRKLPWLTDTSVEAIAAETALSELALT